MNQKTDELRPKRGSRPGLDALDRRLLGALVEDATLSYAGLGERAGLSPPAAHERVKRLRRSGTIRQTAALIDPLAIGKPLLAFVHVDTHGWGKSSELLAVGDFPEVEEIHSVAGDTCMLLKVRTRDTQALESLLAHIYALPGVKGTRSYIALSTYLERPVQAELTAEWQQPEGLQAAKA